MRPPQRFCKETRPNRQRNRNEVSATINRIFQSLAELVAADLV